eukprot:PITA_12422
MRSTESFSGFPYAIALYNCILYTWYGSPLISNGWDNIVVMVVNAVGLLLECCFICIYLTFAPPKPKRKMVGMVIGVLMVFGTIAITSFLAVHDHNKRKAFVGTAGLVATAILYVSPLSVIRTVIQTKSVEYFSFFAFLGSVLWMVYGALTKDIIIMLNHTLFLLAPNFVGVPLGLDQMVLFCVYRANKSQPVENEKMDGGKQRDFIKETSDVEMQLNV